MIFTWADSLASSAKFLGMRRRTPPAPEVKMSFNFETLVSAIQNINLPFEYQEGAEETFINDVKHLEQGTGGQFFQICGKSITDFLFFLLSELTPLEKCTI